MAMQFIFLSNFLFAVSLYKLLPQPTNFHFFQNLSGIFTRKQSHCRFLFLLLSSFLWLWLFNYASMISLLFLLQFKLINIVFCIRFSDAHKAVLLLTCRFRGFFWKAARIGQFFILVISTRIGYQNLLLGLHRASNIVLILFLLCLLTYRRSSPQEYFSQKI